MSTDLVTLSDLPISKYATPDVLKEISGAGGFLPRIQIMGGNNELVKEGKFPIGHFALVQGKNLTDLGTQFVGIIVSWRPKAMQFTPEIISAFDPATDVFKDLQNRADTQQNSGCGYGPEYLIWLPDHGVFATFFYCNPTLRNESPNTHSFLGKVCAFEVTYIKSKKFSWHGATAKKYDGEVTNFPAESVGTVVNKFVNPPETETEVASEDAQVR